MSTANVLILIGKLGGKYALQVKNIYILCYTKIKIMESLITYVTSAANEDNGTRYQLYRHQFEKFKKLPADKIFDIFA